MGFRDAIERPGMKASVTYDPLDDFWYNPVGSTGSTFAGFPVGPSTAMRVAAVQGCVSLIGDTIARLPCPIYKRQKGSQGGKVKATDHWLWPLLMQRPNRRQSPFRFKRYMARQLALRGNAYAEITSRALLPIFPDRVKVEEIDTMDGPSSRYRVKDKFGRERILLQSEMLHLVDDGDDPTMGDSRATLARESIAVSAAAQAFSAKFFKNDATGRLLLTKSGPVPDPTKRAEYAKMIQENYGGHQNASKTMILYGDVQATELGKQTDSAFIVDPQKHMAKVVCGYWRVQPFMLGMDDKVTWGTNIAQIKSAFVDFTALPWGENIQQELEGALLDDNEREDYVIEFLYDDLLRGDTLQRMQAYQIARLIGVLNPNEIRAMENRNPREGGDEYLDTPVGGAPNSGDPAARSLGPRTAPVDTSGEGASVIPAPILADAASRIVGEQLREVSKRLDKVGPQFAAWAKDFFHAQRACAVRVLTPIAASFGFDPWVVEEAADRIEGTAVQALSLEGVPAGWLDRRAAEVSDIITETFRAAAAVARQEAA